MSIPYFSGEYALRAPVKPSKGSTVQHLKECLEAASKKTTKTLLYVKEDQKGNITFATAKKGFFSDWFLKSSLSKLGYSSESRYVADKIAQFIKKNPGSEKDLANSLKSFVERLGSGKHLFTLYACGTLSNLANVETKQSELNSQTSTPHPLSSSTWRTVRKLTPEAQARKDAREAEIRIRFKDWSFFKDNVPWNKNDNLNLLDVVLKYESEKCSEIISALLVIVEQSTTFLGIDLKNEFLEQIKVAKIITTGKITNSETFRFQIAKKIEEHIYKELHFELAIDFKDKNYFPEEIPSIVGLMNLICNQFINHYSKKVHDLHIPSEDYSLHDAEELVRGSIKTDSEIFTFQLLKASLPSIANKVEQSFGFDQLKVKANRSFLTGEQFEKASAEYLPAEYLTQESMEEEKYDFDSDEEDNGEYIHPSSTPSPASSTESSDRSRSVSPIDSNSLASTSPKGRYTVEQYQKLFMILAEKREKAAQSSWLSWRREKRENFTHNKQFSNEVSQHLFDENWCNQYVIQAVNNLGSRKLTHEDIASGINKWNKEIEKTKDDQTSSRTGRSSSEGSSSSTPVKSNRKTEPTAFTNLKIYDNYFTS